MYGASLGWLLGERFAELTVRGRRTGLPRRVVLEVIGRNSTGEIFVASAWGPRAEWFRNLEASPRAEVRVGRRRFAARVAQLDEAAAAAALQEYARAHPQAYRWLIGPLLLGHLPAGTAAEFAALSRAVPVLVLAGA